jgi:hypothetical protein
LKTKSVSSVPPHTPISLVFPSCGIPTLCPLCSLCEILCLILNPVFPVNPVEICSGAHLQSLPQIRDQIVRMLESDGDSQEALGCH